MMEMAVAVLDKPKPDTHEQPQVAHASTHVEMEMSIKETNSSIEMTVME